MKNVNTATEPSVDYRQEKHYIGIRTIAPFSGMFAVVDPLMKELRKWVNQHGIAEHGPYFLRYHVIDMNGPMDIEVGFMVPTPLVGDELAGDERVKPGVLPAGNYANLVYSGGGMRGNKTLIEWAKANGIPWDRWDDPNGDGFRCRYEAYLTDYRVEPRKTRWQVDLAIKVKDEYKHNAA